MSTATLELLSSLMMFVGALGIIVVRIKASGKPTNVRKILIPPLAMSTGFFMFFSPRTHDPLDYALLAFLVGCVFSYPLILTSKMYIMNGQVFLKRSKWFIVLLLVLVMLRMILHGYVEQYVDIYQTGSLFFILAYGMIIPWRIAMYIQYRKLFGTVEDVVSSAS
jgi:membrane protein CcdC involved in cytochrome C biogenesis